MSKQQIKGLFSNFQASQFARLQYADVSEITKVQNALLKEHLRFAAENSPYYKNLFAHHHINIDEINTVADLKKLPYTEKADLIQFNQDFQAVTDSTIIDICLTSATSGAQPTQLTQTQSDLTRLAYNEEIALAMSGITSEDTLLVAAALDRAFMAGLAYFMGGVKLNARMVRGGAGSAAQHWELIKSTGVTAIVGVPSLMNKIADYALEKGENPAQTKVRRLIAIGEPTRDKDLELLPLPKHLEKVWQADIYSTYASTELATTFCECESRCGGHLRPELMVVEIVDENDQIVADGQQGEVIVTPLGVTGMPLIRFRTGDISFLMNETCGCGRTTPRLAPILGRKQQMLKYKGTTLFPNSILAALEGHPGFYGGYVEARRDGNGLDQVTLFAHWDKEKLPQTQLEEELRAKIRVVPHVEFLSAEEVDGKVYQYDKKRKRAIFFDLR